jgi:hypothetical protein
MCSTPIKLAIVTAGSSLVIGVSACAGRQLLDLGGDAGGDGAAPPGADFDAAFVTGSTVPCDYGICSPPDVCCTSWRLSFTCEAESLCQDVAIGCTMATCPAGSVCCALLDESPNRSVGWSRCVQASQCPDGTRLACAQGAIIGTEDAGVGCPPDELCYNNGVGFPTCQPPDGGAD